MIKILNLKAIKRLGLGAMTLGLVVAGAAAFSAFEAHVINVTARIENALKVNTTPIDFGTVFPQEQLDRQFDIALSDSFQREDRVDDVEYFLRQKPKCGVTTNNGEVLVGPTATGHIIPTLDDPATPQDESNGGTAYTVDCGPDPRQLDAAGQPLPPGSNWGPLPSLCPYLSKHEITPDNDPATQGENDGSTPAFHQPFTVATSTVAWLDTPGRLAKSAQDFLDTWDLDLKVPCFGGYCAQDWASFVHKTNPQANPADYTQPIGNEHKIFGCDLWVEVSNVSEKRTE